MTSTTISFAAAALFGIVALSGACQAADATFPLTIKPLQGVSFDVGPERAASYFTSANDRCKLVVTTAREPNWDAPTPFSVSRFEATIGAGQAVRFVPRSGQVFEFACGAGTLALHIKKFEQVAETQGQ